MVMKKVPSTLKELWYIMVGGLISNADIYSFNMPEFIGIF